MDQILELLFWLPETKWRIVATLTSAPAPASFNAEYVRDWISEIASTVEFQGYPKAFIVTEIDEDRHPHPWIHVLLGGTDRPCLSNHKETWENRWKEIGAGWPDIKCFAEERGRQAMGNFAYRLSDTGIFYVELDLGFGVMQSADTGFYSKVWESFCVPFARRKPSQGRVSVR